MTELKKGEMLSKMLVIATNAHAGQFDKVPNVSNPEVNFVSFKSLNGTSPQWGNNNVDMTQVNIEYIIDNNNSITKPINDSEGINLNTIRQTFAEALIESSPDDNILRYTPTNATILLNNVEVSGSDLSTLNDSWPLYKSGYRIEPILYTQTASYDANNNVIGFGYTGSITFVQGEQGSNVTKNDYMMYAPGVNDVLTLGMTLPAVLHFSQSCLLSIFQLLQLHQLFLLNLPQGNYLIFQSGNSIV